jgi:poly(A) polymerase
MKNDADIHVRQIAKQAVQRLQSAGYVAFWAGGCVRDILMGITPKDYDIATNAMPEDVARLFPGSVEVGKSFGVVRAPLEDIFFDIAMFRRDHSYTDGRRPERVTPSDPETDASRRDFTINAIFYDPVTEQTYDYVGGKNDIAAHIVRCVGAPSQRFQEDHLRMLRAVRFASVLGFSIEPDTARAISENANLIGRISAERIHDELVRILVESPRPGDALVLLDKLALLKEILPEITDMKGVNQPKEFHPEGDVFAHTVVMLNMMKSPTPILALSVLLHDIGKPATATLDADRIRFNRHADKGADITEVILHRLKFSSDDIKTITHCVRNHMRFQDVQKMRASTLRRLVGAPTFPVELELHRLDCCASHNILSNWDFLVEQQRQMASEPILPDPWIRGDDIISLGVLPGRDVGIWKKKAYDAQLEKTFAGRDELLAWLNSEIHR